VRLWNQVLSPPRFLLGYNKSLDEGPRPIPLHNSERNYSSTTFKETFHF
jgi:hypothetical protein